MLLRRGKPYIAVNGRLYIHHSIPITILGYKSESDFNEAGTCFLNKGALDAGRPELMDRGRGLAAKQFPPPAGQASLDVTPLVLTSLKSTA